MFGTAVAVALSVVFLVTGTIGVSALARGGRTGVPGGCGDTRSTELLHVVMSVAMIAMAWGWTGGPATPGGAAQVAVFSLAVLALAAVAVRDAQRGRGRESRGARLSHGLTAGATVWMVAAMPLLMTHAAEPAATAPGAAAMPGMTATPGMAAMPEMAGMAHAGHAAATAPVVGVHGAGWASAASTALVAVLVVVGLAWAVRAYQLGSPAHRAYAHGASAGAPVVVPAPRLAPDGALSRTLTPVGGAAGTAPAAKEIDGRKPGRSTGESTGEAPEPTRRATLAASCHALMSLGMAAMLAAML